jgi:hypothetical protein
MLEGNDSVCSENHADHVNAICRQTVQFLKVLKMNMGERGLKIFIQEHTVSKLAFVVFNRITC